MNDAVITPVDINNYIHYFTPHSTHYEYLDHTADIQIHSWGININAAIEQCVMGMYNYMTDCSKVDGTTALIISSTGHDSISCLYNFLDEALYLFYSEYNFVLKDIHILKADINSTGSIQAVVIGEQYNPINKHTQGTEIKAITYSNMQILKTDDKYNVYVIVDI